MAGGVVMPENLNELLNRPLICADKGSKQGTIKDVILTPDKREAVGLILTGRGFDRKVRAVFMRDVLKIGRDAVIVDNPGCIRILGKSAFSGAGLYTTARNLLGRKVFSKEGDDLGTVDDVLINWDTRRIESFEMSDGLFQDMMMGKKQLPLIGLVEFGEENVLVEKEAREEMENSGGGIKNRFFGER